MAAELESMFYSEERGIPWHGAGKPVKGLATSIEALKASGLDWLAEKIPMYAQSPYTQMSSWGTSLEPKIAQITEERNLEVPGQYAIVRDRDNAILGTVGSRYKIHQNWQSFDLMEGLVGSANALFDTAGSLQGGKLTFITMQMPETLLVAGEDPIERYLVLANSFDGSMQLTVMRSNIRVVCKNTLNLAMQTAPAMWSIRHTESMDDRVKEVKRALELSDKYDVEFEQTMNQLIGTDFSKSDFEKMAKTLWPSKERGDGNAQRQMAAIGVFESSTTVTDAWRYTSYGALQAVAELADWITPRKSSKDKTYEEQQTEAVWFGTPLKEKTKTLAYLLAA